jgi:hypothetical protein
LHGSPFVYQGCPEGVKVEFWRLEGSPHNPSPTVFAQQVFFKSFLAALPNQMLPQLQFKILHQNDPSRTIGIFSLCCYLSFGKTIIYFRFLQFDSVNF